MKQISFIVVLALIVVATAVIFRPKPTPVSPSDNAIAEYMKIQVAATFYPLGEFARQVGGDAVDVSVIVPAGTEPHEYEPTPKDIAAIYSADVFVANGAGMDAWALKIRPELESKGVKVVVMSEALGFEGGDVSEHDEKEGIDPHFWLDPVLAQNEVMVIKEALAQVDTKHTSTYADNAVAYTEKLSALDRSYRDNLGLCSSKMIVTSHAAFGYLAREYDFEVLSIAGFSPESEPSSRQLADLAKLSRQKGIRYVFFESLVSPRLAQTLADEIGAKTLVFNPLEGLTDDEVSSGANYISIMSENLDNLRLAMDCYGK